MTTRHLSHKWLKSIGGSTWAELREKSITRTGQDRTIKKSQKRNISHIWGKAPRKDIAMKFGTGIDVLEVVTWAEFDHENLMGVNFTGGQIFICGHSTCKCLPAYQISTFGVTGLRDWG